MTALTMTALTMTTLTKINDTMKQLNVPEIPSQDIRVKRHVGSGYIGSVYLSQYKDPTTNEWKSCMMKQVPLSSESSVNYTLQEADILQKFTQQNSHIIKLYGYSHNRNILSLLIEKTKANHDLSKHISLDCYWKSLSKQEYDTTTSYTKLSHEGTYWDYTMSQKDRLYLCKQMCLAIQQLQTYDIAHCDVKPENMLFDGDKIILIDFQVSQSYKDTDSGACSVGTLGYMPPELEDGWFSDKTDIYSLGVSMLQIWFGDIWSNDKDDFDIMRRCVTDYMCLLLDDYEPLYQVILPCISLYEENRPTIQQLISNLDHIQSSKSSNSKNSPL